VRSPPNKVGLYSGGQVTMVGFVLSIYIEEFQVYTQEAWHTRLGGGVAYRIGCHKQQWPPPPPCGKILEHDGSGQGGPLLVSISYAKIWHRLTLQLVTLSHCRSKSLNLTRGTVLMLHQMRKVWWAHRCNMLPTIPVGAVKWVHHWWASGVWQSPIHNGPADSAELSQIHLW